ncbi:ATP-binding protein [Bifidobacterium stellenboschense]|uniref:Exopolyphosphatase n=1 Tax=Bifidobacterium stellenboschense TaxID=762211 RepID=A0A087DQQ5_9BIFI|nr:ATP-binding protein [Bifidobacterium stellenboschense]KFI97855.1 exopolyphosphatase [Bifidobacterium stellenboschense]
MDNETRAIMHGLNPFAPGAGRPPKDLAGREHELEIMDRIISRTKAGYTSRGLVYSGLRGMGKTVLLLRMRDMVINRGLLAIRMEATTDSGHDYAAIFEGISKAVLKQRDEGLRDRLLAVLRHIDSISANIGIIQATLKPGAEDETPSSDSFRLEMMVEELCTELKHDGSGLFLFIDEFQEMPAELMGTIIGLQHAMGQDGLPFYVIAAGLPNLPGVLTKSRSYAERLFEYRKIGRLPENETRDCYVKTISRVSRFEDAALDRLVELSQGYPYFIQAYGSAAFEAADSSPIPRSAVGAGEPVARAALDNGLYESRWQRARPSEREYMRAMASVGKDTCSSAEVAEKLHRPVPEVARARKGIIEAGLAYSPERGFIAFTVPGMADYIRRTGPLSEQTYDESEP